MPVNLQEKRFHAALASEGISAGPIYQTVLQLCRSLQLHGDLLEFGAGTGTLAKQLSASHAGGTITCADIRSRPASLPANVLWLQTDLNNPIPVPDNSFDIIISTEVIEHLENPRATFREFHRLLHSDGVLIVTTPNQESIRSLADLLMGGHFVAFLTAAIQLISAPSCSRTSSGFATRPASLPQFNYADYGGLLELPQVRWQFLTFGLLKGRLFSDNLAVVTRKS
jgi:ubiquinone/menaquinone biosynthesis C-methylase UbiE